MTFFLFLPHKNYICSPRFSLFFFFKFNSGASEAQAKIGGLDPQKIRGLSWGPTSGGAEDTGVPLPRRTLTRSPPSPPHNAVHALLEPAARRTNPVPRCWQRNNKQVRWRPVGWSRGCAITHRRCRGSGLGCPLPALAPPAPCPPPMRPPPQRQDVKPRVQNRGAAWGSVGGRGLCWVGTKGGGRGGKEEQPSLPARGRWGLGASTGGN